MEVIALRGNSNTGKSETVNIVYQYLMLFGYAQVPGHFRGPLGNPVMRDFIDVVEKKGVLIGIVTQGDYAIGPESVKTHLAALQAAGCVKAVCACTTKPGTINAVKAYPHVFVDKTIATSPAQERVVNAFDAEKIYKLI